MTEKTNKRALLFIFITLFVDVMGIGIIIPVLPKLIMGMAHCTLEHATVIGGRMGFIYAFMQFFFSPVLGALSDRFGRRTVLLISLFGFGIDYLILGFAKTIVVLFIGRLIAGITGASFTVAGAYIADISPPEKRAQNFGIIGAAFGLGFIAGPALGGALAHFGPRIPFFAAAGLSLLNWLYGFFILPESLKPENRRKFQWKRANPLGSLLQLSKHPVVVRMAVVFFLVNLAGQSLPNVWSYYTIKRYHWTEAGVGLSLTYVGMLIAIVQGGLTRIIIPKIGEKRSIYFGLIMNIIGMTGIALSGNPLWLFVATVPLTLGGLAGPSMQSVLSKAIPANEQGELQGFMNSVMSITAIIGPLLMPWLFSTFSNGYHGIILLGAPYFCSAILSSAALIYALIILKNYIGKAKSI
ncbi:MAG: TCR/Tet family MFS transporter [Bacteroidetes bacterium]|nr:TCR/Tet family MFS transporter [Bacteroidota bacterium]